MKTAKEMRKVAEAVNPAEILLSGMTVLIPHHAENGKMSFIYFIKKTEYYTKDIDWCISELVALGYTCEIDDDQASDYYQLKIAW